MSNAQGNPLPRLDSIQFLRGLAALMVVFHHALRSLLENKQSEFSFEAISLFDASVWMPLGGVGVDVFFVISGLVMVYVSRPYVAGVKPVSDFLFRRVVRIYPLYLFVTGLLIALVSISYFLKANVALPDSLHWYRILTSLLLIPSFDAKGVPHPVLGVGWTLMFEMLFYGCFALALLVNRKYLVTLCSLFVIVVLLVAVGTVELLGAKNAVSVFYSNAIVLEFIFGCIVARLAISGKTLSRYPALFVLFVSCLAIYLSTHFGLHKESRVLFWGIPAVGLVYSLVSIEWRSSGVKWPRALTYLGDISYSLYLIHIVVIYSVYFKALKVLGITSSDVVATEWILVGAVICSLLAGVVLYHVVEKPTLSVLNRVVRRRQLAIRTAIA
ncbi:MAG: acyltransferase [Ketobacter sp.]|nr:MAG: acyltransferase [Ketobacter sp.]